MKPNQPENVRPQFELLRTRLESFINLEHPLARLAKEVNWSWFDEEFGRYFVAKTGSPAKPTRTMVALTYIKYTYNLSDEQVIEDFVRDPYFQYFCGYEYFQHKSPCDPTTLGRWRRRIGEEGAEKLLTETLSIAHKLGLISLNDLKSVIVDTTVQEKNITHPTDSKLINKARENLVNLAKSRSIELRQSYTHVGKKEAHRCSRLLHAKQFNRAQTSIKKQKTMLGRVIRDIRRKTDITLDPKLQDAIAIATKIRWQERKSENKVYSIHESHVECICKGKAAKPYEFGNKVSLAVTARKSWVVGAKSFFGRPYDGATLKPAIAQIERLTGASVEKIFVDKGYRGKVHHPANKMILISGRKALLPPLQRLLKRRSAIEPVIGHNKQDHRLGRNYLKKEIGDRINPVFGGAAFNLRKIMRSFPLLLHYWAEVLFGSTEMVLIKAHY
jgi:transposase, IS5 family